MSAMNIIFLIDSSRCINKQGGTLQSPIYYPAANNDGGHPSFIYGYNGTGDYTLVTPPNTSTTAVPVSSGDEVYISLRELNSNPDVTFAPVGFIAMTWGTNANWTKNPAFQQGQLPTMGGGGGTNTNGQAVFGSPNFLSVLENMNDYQFSGQPSSWGADSLNTSYWATTNDAKLQTPTMRGPYIMLPTILNQTGTLGYGLRFYCSVAGKLIGTYEFDPAIAIS